jgi:multiple sugar transport system permease protein
VTAVAGVSPARAPRSLALAQQERAAYLFLSPWLIGLFGLTLGPTLVSLYLSFTSFDLLQEPRWIGLDNYARMAFADQRYRNALAVTFTYVTLSVPLKLAFALALAMALDKGLRALTLYRSLLYLPSLLGGSVAIAVLWRQVFGWDGLVNEALALFGIDGPSWISNPRYAIYTLVLLRVWQFGSPMIIFLAGLRQIPQELYEAAAIDGASGWRRFWSITLPLLRPVLLFVLVTHVIGSFQIFGQVYILTEGGPGDATRTVVQHLYETAFRNFFHFGSATAMAWVLFMIILGFSLLQFRLLRGHTEY